MHVLCVVGEEKEMMKTKRRVFFGEGGSMSDFLEKEICCCHGEPWFKRRKKENGLELLLCCCHGVSREVWGVLETQ